MAKALRTSEGRVLAVHATVTESTVGRLLEAGLSPAQFIDFVLHEIPLQEWMDRFKNSQIEPGNSDRVEWVTNPEIEHEANPGGRSQEKNQEKRSISEISRTGPWSPQSFARFLDTIRARNDFESPIRLLHAYTKLGPSPTSAELKEMCGFNDENKWQLELRAAKARLTIFARRMGHPPLFIRPQTTEHGSM